MSLPSADLSDKPALVTALIQNEKLRTRDQMLIQQGGIVEDIGEVQYANSTMNTNVLNCVQGGDFTQAENIDAVRQIKDYFAGRGLRFTLWVSPPGSTSSTALRNLQDAGYVLTDEFCVGMAASLANTVATTSPHPPPTDISVSRAIDQDKMRDFGEIINTCFPPPPYPDYCDFADYYSKLAANADLSKCIYKRFVGYVDGKAVATSGVMIANGVAGIYDIATRPEAQRRGYAAVMMKTVLDEARDSGCTVTVLAASQDGKGVYERLGFQEIGKWLIFHEKK